MSTTYIASTELDAVNIMLGVIGELPVNSVDESGVSESSIASNVLHDTSRVVQSLRLECNTDTAYTLVRTVDSKVIVPTNALGLDPCERGKRFVQRAGFLWDKDNHTFILEEDVKVDIVWFLPFNDLPQVVKTYITVTAARQFQMDVLGSKETDEKLREAHMLAWGELKRQQIDVGDYNMMTSGDWPYENRRQRY